MKKSITIFIAVLCAFAFSGIVSAQNSPIDFESGGHGASWTWAVFENDTNPALEIIPNPDATGANTSATVAKFTALQTGNPWAGCESMHGSDIGTFTLDATNSVVKIMVWKPVISDVGLKFAKPDGAALVEIKVANTVTNQWEELTFDFTSRIGDPNTVGQDQIIVFPDFDLNGRTQENVCYFDNITFHPAGGGGSTPTVAAPTPTHPESDVISIFSDAYTDVAGTDFNPNWGQGTAASQVSIAGNNTLQYAGLDYQGTQLGSNQNLSGAGMEFLHIDFWTTNSTLLNVSIISPGPLETPYALTVPTSGWSSVDIPLSAFSPPVNLADVFQLKFDGNGDIFLDNIYFSKVVTGIEEISDVNPSAYALEQNYPNPFNPSTAIRFIQPNANHVTLKVYDLLGQEIATLVNEFKNAGAYEVTFDASNLPSGIYLYSISTGDFNAVKKMMLIK